MGMVLIWSDLSSLVAALLLSFIMVSLGGGSGPRATRQHVRRGSTYDAGSTCDATRAAEEVTRGDPKALGSVRKHGSCAAALSRFLALRRSPCQSVTISGGRLEPPAIFSAVSWDYAPGTVIAKVAS